MTLDQAMQNIDTALASVNGSRQYHAVLLSAMEIVKKELKKKEEGNGQDKTN